MATAKGRMTRRRIMKGAAIATAAPAIPVGWAIAQARPLRIGLLLPYSGAFARLGENITHAVQILVAEKDGRLGGRDVEIIRLDDESRSEVAEQGARRLVKEENVDALIGTVHPAAQLGLHKVVSESGTLTIVPGAGNDALTRELCVKNVFRTSFSNWQPAYGMGLAAAEKGYRKGVWVTWDYAAGSESGAGFKEAFEQGGGQMLPDLTLPFPQTNFQPLLAQIPGLGVDVVGAYFAGGGAVLFVKAYAAAGLQAPLCGPGFLTEGALEAQGPAAEGIETALHYGDGLDYPKNLGFRRAFKDKAGRDADVFAVQGYDAAQLLAVGVEAVQGTIEDEANLHKALRAAKMDSPRGPLSMSRAQNAAHHIYLRRAENGRNRVLAIAVDNLADPGTGCRLE
jgi:branched-chain amino acid transport system substrate-binding protein